jgi:long-chain acyl-CoA synthetase
VEESRTWRLIKNPEGEAVDVLAYPSALIEGRIAGKYMLSNEKLPDTIVVQGFKSRGILAGADVEINREAAAKQGIGLARFPRSGRGGPKPVGTIDFSDLMKSASRKFKAADPAPEAPAVILYTSGTTGKPKGVTLTHRNFIAQCNMVEKLMPMKPEDKVILVLPLFHVYGLANGLVCSTRFGCSMSLIPQYSPAKLLENIASVKATLLIAVPTMYMHLLQLARARKTAMPKSLRLSVSGGAPMPVSVLNEFIELFETRIAEGYGLTETTSAVCLNKSGDKYKPGSIGPAPEDVQIRVVNDNNEEVADGTEGEIVIRGEMVTPGYWNNQEATDEVFIEGWFHTGDLGYRDEDGCFFITDRKKDIIVRGGFNISPREIEEVLLQHPAVMDAAVVAVTDKRERELVKAFVVLKENQSATNQELLSFCRENLAEYKVPKVVELRESLPKSATGKILRRELRDGEKSDERLIHQKEDSHE